MTAKLSDASLLGPDDPAPVELIREHSPSPLFLVCEHAGRGIPAALGDLGVADDVIDSHRGWDIGAEALALALSERLDAPLVVQRYSRLVIDCNRPPGSAQSIPEASDGETIPANIDLGRAERDARRTAIFAPFDQAVAAGLAAHPRRVTFSIHSFTPRLSKAKPAEQDRPWHAGFMARKDERTPKRLRDHITAAAPDLVLAINQPYQIEDDTDWFIPAHAERCGLAHCLIEIRNDGLDTSDGVARFSDLLAAAIASLPELQP